MPSNRLGRLHCKSQTNMSQRAKNVPPVLAQEQRWRMIKLNLRKVSTQVLPGSFNRDGLSLAFGGDLQPYFCLGGVNAMYGSNRRLYSRNRKRQFKRVWAIGVQLPPVTLIEEQQLTLLAKHQLQHQRSVELLIIWCDYCRLRILACRSAIIAVAQLLL